MRVKFASYQPLLLLLCLGLLLPASAVFGVAPTVSSFSPALGPVGTSVTITGTNFTGATAVKFNGTSASTFTVNSSTSISATVATGTTTGQITVTTSGGTGTSSGNPDAFVITTSGGPGISTFGPAAGGIGTVVTLHGIGFTGATAVKFHGTNASSFTVSSDTLMTATVASGTTTGQITVTTSLGTGTSYHGFHVFYISGFSPTSGIIGTSVVITGLDFTSTSAVKFNGTSASFTINSDTQVTATVPTGATTGPIGMTNGAGSPVTSTSNFTVLFPPAAPTGLTATPGDSQVTLSWTAPSGSVTGYKIYRSTTSGTETLLASPSGTATTYLDSAVSNNTTYYYKVTALNSDGEGAKSNEASATPIAPPYPPTNLVARAGNTQVSLNWVASATATSYNVKRSTDEWGTYTTISSPTTTSFTNTGLTNGTTYYYVVSAVNASGEGYDSDPVSATPGSTPLPAPTGLFTRSGNGIVQIFWQPVTGADSYNIYRSTTPGGESTLVPTYGNIGESGGVFDAYADTNVTNGTTYYYKVTAVNVDGEGARSSEISGTAGVSPLTAPGNLIARPGNHQVTLNWIPVSGATSYDLFYYYPGLPDWELCQQGITGSTYTHTGLTNGVNYSYVLLAVNVGGEGPPSNTASATPGSTPLPAPTGLHILSANGNLEILWNPVSGASTYNIYRSTTPGGESTIIPTYQSVGTSNGVFIYYVDTGVTNGTTYYYKITAVNAAGEGARSTEGSGVPGGTRIAAPTNLIARAGNTQVTLTWNRTAHATSYTLYYYYPGLPDWKLCQQGITGTTYTNTGLTNGTTYSYMVAGVNAASEGLLSNTASAKPGSTPLAAPTGLYTQSGDGYVLIFWNPVAGANYGYNIYRSTTSGGEPTGTPTYQYVGTTSSGVVYYGDSNVTNNTTYYYIVTAVNSDGEGARSAEVSCKAGGTSLIAPILSGLTGTNQVTLNWNAVADATSYNLYYHVPSGGWLTCQTGITGTSYVHTGLTTNTTYTYYVVGANSGGTGTNSNVADTDITATAVPTSVTFARGSSGVVSINAATGGNMVMPLTYSVSGAPSGTTAVFYPPNMAIARPRITNALSTASTSLILCADATTAPGTYNLVVTVNCGVTSSQVTVPVTIL